MSEHVTITRRDAEALEDLLQAALDVLEAYDAAQDPDADRDLTGPTVHLILRNAVDRYYGDGGDYEPA